jgi:hypothetical protein
MYVDIPSNAAVGWKPPVANVASLPLYGNSNGDVRVTLDTYKMYIWEAGISSWVVAAGGGSAEWGSISGILSNQTDLQNALNLKANLASPTFTGIVTTPALNISGLTPSEPVVTDGSNNLVSIPYSTFEANINPLTTVSLNDDQTSPLVIASWDTSLYTSIHLIYSISRGTNIESGILNIASNGTSSSINASDIEVGSSGISFTSAMSGSLVELLYTSTNVGMNATFKYKTQAWLG